MIIIIGQKKYNYLIKTKSERLEKRKLTNTWEYWKWTLLIIRK